MALSDDSVAFAVTYIVVVAAVTTAGTVVLVEGIIDTSPFVTDGKEGVAV